MKFYVAQTLVLSTALLLACGGEAPNDGKPDPIVDPVDDPTDDPTDDPIDDPTDDPVDDPVLDTTPPTLVTTSPTDGAIGQRSDIRVSFVFSEAMDRASVEGTLDASELGAVSLEWNEAGDTLTVIPDAPLAYAESRGVDPSIVPALRYVVTLGSAAKDLAGNPLGDGTQIIFHTLKSLHLTVRPVAELSRSMTPAILLYQNDDPLVIGDDGNNQGIRTALTFDISALPESAVAIASAILVTQQTMNDNQGAPFADLGGAVLLDHVSFDNLDDENAINYAFNSNQFALLNMSGFCSEEQVDVEYDLTDRMDDDLKNREARNGRSQYLLRFAIPTDLDDAPDRAVFSRDALHVNVAYLAP